MTRSLSGWKKCMGAQMTWANPNLCKYCDEPPVLGKTCCSKHAKEQSQQTIARRKNKLANGLCAYGGCRSPHRPNRTTCAACALKKKRPTPEQAIARLQQIKTKKLEDADYNLRSIACTRRWQRNMQAVIFKKYGSRCNNSSCGWINEDGSKGCTDIRCLQIDHVNGGGNKEIKQLSFSVRLRKILDDTEGVYQLLCSNCNWIKRTTNNEIKKRERI